MGRNQNTYAKRQREIAKKRKAAEKRERRWAKKEQESNLEGIEAPLRVLTEEDSAEAIAARLLLEEKRKKSAADQPEAKEGSS